MYENWERRVSSNSRLKYSFSLTRRSIVPKRIQIPDIEWREVGSRSSAKEISSEISGPTDVSTVGGEGKGCGGRRVNRRVVKLNSPSTSRSRRVREVEMEGKFAEAREPQAVSQRRVSRVCRTLATRIAALTQGKRERGGLTACKQRRKGTRASIPRLLILRFNRKPASWPIIISKFMKRADLPRPRRTCARLRNTCRSTWHARTTY